MVKKYRRLTDEERHDLVVLIHQEGYTIKDASRKLNIPYPNAKAVNQTYLLENRTAKKNFRFRMRFADFGSEMQLKRITEQLNGATEEEIVRRTCGIRKIKWNQRATRVSRVAIFHTVAGSNGCFSGAGSEVVPESCAAKEFNAQLISTGFQTCKKLPAIPATSMIQDADDLLKQREHFTNQHQHLAISQIIQSNSSGSNDQSRGSNEDDKAFAATDNNRLFIGSSSNSFSNCLAGLQSQRNALSNYQKFPLFFGHVSAVQMQKFSAATIEETPLAKASSSPPSLVSLNQTNKQRPFDPINQQKLHSPPNQFSEIYLLYKRRQQLATAQQNGALNETLLLHNDDLQCKLKLQESKEKVCENKVVSTQSQLPAVVEGQNTLVNAVAHQQKRLSEDSSSMSGSIKADHQLSAVQSRLASLVPLSNSNQLNSHGGTILSRGGGIGNDVVGNALYPTMQQAKFHPYPAPQAYPVAAPGGLLYHSFSSPWYVAPAAAQGVHAFLGDGRVYSHSMYAPQAHPSLIQRSNPQFNGHHKNQHVSQCMASPSAQRQDSINKKSNISTEVASENGAKSDLTNALLQCAKQ